MQLIIPANLSPERVLGYFTAIPRDETSVDLSKNGYYPIGMHSLDEIGAFYKAMPPSMLSLDLSRNRLDLLGCTRDGVGLLAVDPVKKAVSLEKMVKMLPTKLTSLSLSGNDFEEFDADGFVKAMQELPGTLTSFKLSMTNLKPDTLIRVVRALRPTITSLELGDCLEHFPPQYRRVLLESIQATTVEFREHASFNDWEEIKKLLPSTVNTVIINGTIIDMKAFRKAQVPSVTGERRELNEYKDGSKEEHKTFHRPSSHHASAASNSTSDESSKSDFYHYMTTPIASDPETRFSRHPFSAPFGNKDSERPSFQYQNLSTDPSDRETAIHSGQGKRIHAVSNISMLVLSGFITAVGIAAVLLAIFASAATFGMPALFIAGGVVATLTGVGLFARNYKNLEVIEPIQLSAAQVEPA